MIIRIVRIKQQVMVITLQAARKTCNRKLAQQMALELN